MIQLKSKRKSIYLLWQFGIFSDHCKDEESQVMFVAPTLSYPSLQVKMHWDITSILLVQDIDPSVGTMIVGQDIPSKKSFVDFTQVSYSI